MLTKFISWLFHRDLPHVNTSIFNSIRIGAIVKQLGDNGLIDIEQYENDVETMIIKLLNVNVGEDVA